MGDKIKTLSQAIRLGATIRPQCQGNLFRHGKSCALGAAFEALTGVGDDAAYMESTCPSAGSLFRKRFNVTDDMLNDIAYLNDNKGHTREQIADMLEAEGL